MLPLEYGWCQAGKHLHEDCYMPAVLRWQKQIAEDRKVRRANDQLNCGC